MQWSWDEFKKIGYGFKSGQTNQKYKTVLNRLNVIETEKQELPETIIKSFKNEEYKSYITIDDIILYRVYGLTPSGTAGAKQLGSFATTEFAESRIDVKLRLALDPQWKNALYIEEKIMVPKGIVLNIGIVAPVKLLSGTILPGGAEQVLLPQDWNENWVVGYRYVTSAPLMEYPTYSSEKINEVRPNTLKTSAEK